jgi:hypothetical protein
MAVAIRAVVTKPTTLLAIVVWGLLVASDAGAVGGVIASSGEAVAVMQARYAVAMSPAQTTRWASIQVEKFPGAMAWLLPIRQGARVDEVSDAWFESLELATAPRVVALQCDASADSPVVRMEGLPDRVPSQRSLHGAVIENAPALRAFAGEWALELPSAIERRFEDLQTRGFLLTAFVYSGPAGGGFTRTVRITDDSFPSVPLFMTLGPKLPVEVTAYLIGSSRARLGAGSEIEIDPEDVRIAKDGSSDYKSVRTRELLAAGGDSWVIEASESDLFSTGARRPGGVELAPSILSIYDPRAASYGDSTSDPTLALYGLDSGKIWVTRAVGIVLADRFGDDVATTLAPGMAKSPFLVLKPPPSECAAMQPPTMTTPPSSVVSPASPLPRQDPPPRQDPVLVETTVVDAPPPQPVEVSGSCDGSPQSQPQETSSDDSCGHSDTSSGSTSDDGCDGSSDQSSDQSGDGCDSSSSDSSEDQSSGCDSSSSSSSSSSSDCSLARRSKRHRSRTSLVAWAICAVLLPLRRISRKREC